jgi:hypothetical protein
MRTHRLDAPAEHGLFFVAGRRLVSKSISMDFNELEGV